MKISWGYFNEVGYPQNLRRICFGIMTVRILKSLLRGG